MRYSIRQTGVYKFIESQEPLFTQVVISEQYLQELKEREITMESLCKHNSFDFVSLQLDEAELQFLHVTSLHNLQSIKTHGLRYKANDYIPDLGEGIYLVDRNSIEGMENLKDYLTDFEDDELAVITGTFVGSIQYCIHGEGHKGYVLVKDTIKPEDLSIEIMKTSDFLYNY